MWDLIVSVPDHCLSFYFPFPLRSYSIRFSTGSYSFKLETDYNFCNEVKEGMSAIRRFYCPRENIRHTDITVAFNQDQDQDSYW